MEVETGIEPVCTALQAVASPLGHSTAGVDATHLRADDGIRTRDPHLGKVMRYQLRYIRAQRTRSSPGAKDDDSPIERAHTNLLARTASRLSRWCREAHMALNLGAQHVLTFTLVRLSAPVPWLSGRASASHAEGRWFDPSRDHSLFSQVKGRK